MSEPLTDHHKKYAKWQEASRKDVERAFGVLQRKFYFVKDVEQLYVSDITKAVETCVILHNMMVQEHVDRDEQELHDWCEYNNNDDAPTDNNNITIYKSCFMMVLQLIWRWRITSNNVYYLTSIKRSSIADGNAFTTALNSSI
jgi:hypothetical protein